MAENFYTILTNVGKAKLANAQALGTTVQFSSIAVGDGSGNYYDPIESQTALKNEVWRGAINQIKTDSENPNWIIVEVVIPTSTGGFTVREAGIVDSEGDVIAIGKYPATYKPALAEGSGKDLYIRMILEVSNASTIMLKIDPAIVLSTRGYVDESIAEHNTDPLAHGNLPYLKTSQASDFWQVADAPFLVETTGYQKLPSGLILQWGVSPIAAQAANPVVFPIAFPNRCAFVTSIYAGGTQTDLTRTIGIGNMTTTGFSLAMQKATTGTYLETNYMYWFAIGY